MCNSHFNSPAAHLRQGVDESHRTEHPTQPTQLTPWRVLDTREALEDYYLDAERPTMAGVTPRLFSELAGEHYFSLVDLLRLSSRVEAKLTTIGPKVDIRLGSGPARAVMSAVFRYLKAHWRLQMVDDGIPYAGSVWIVGDGSWLLAELQAAEGLNLVPGSFYLFVSGLTTRDLQPNPQSVPVIWH